MTSSNLHNISSNTRMACNSINISHACLEIATSGEFTRFNVFDSSIRQFSSSSVVMTMAHLSALRLVAASLLIILTTAFVSTSIQHPSCSRPLADLGFSSDFSTSSLRRHEDALLRPQSNLKMAPRTLSLSSDRVATPQR